MTLDEHLKLTELLCSRLCHDLAGPIGAIGTGTELLGDEDMGPDMADEAMALLASSAACASHRLRFLRAALGSAGGALTQAQLRGLASAFLEQPMSVAESVVLDWQDGGAVAWTSDEAKLLCNLILTARDCLPRGGSMILRTRQPDLGLWAALTVKGLGATLAESALALEAQGVEGLTPRAAQGYYLALLGQRMSHPIERIADKDSVDFRVG